MTDLNTRIREHIAYAYQNAPAIKAIMDKAGVTPEEIPTVDDLAKIPVTHKDDLVRMHEENPPFGGFLAVDIDTLPRIYISPGPIYDPQPYDPVVAESGLAAFKQVGFGKGDRVINTFMYHLTPAGLLIDEALRALEATVIPTGPGNTDLQIKMIMDLGASGYAGTPSYLMTLLDRMAEMGIPKEAVPLKKALFSAEPYTPSQRARFENEYGMVTTSAYGTADLGFVGYTKPNVQGFCIVSHVFLQICNPQSGEPLPVSEMGEIVATVFNRGYPLIRFGTGDLGILAETPSPECGGQQLLGLFGRTGEAVKVRGMFLHPNQMNMAKKQFPEIKHMQAIITRPANKDVITLRIELKEGAQDNQLAERMKEFVRNAVRLRIDHVEIVPPGVIDPTQREVIDERKWD